MVYVAMEGHCDVQYTFMVMSRDDIILVFLLGGVAAIFASGRGYNAFWQQDVS